MSTTASSPASTPPRADIPAPAPDWSAFDTLMADGRVVHIRPITTHDGDRLIAFHEALSDETVYYRFFSFRPHLSPDEVKRFTHVDYVDRMALVAEVDGELAAIGRYDRIADGEAEVAFVVADRYQGRGLGTLLLEHLAERAQQVGITRFVADTLPTNQRMLAVFRDAGFHVVRRLDHGLIHVEFPLDQTDQLLAAREERESTATVASLQPLLRPKSVAVVGASRRPGTIGHALFANLIQGGFEGIVYPVNPRTGHVGGVRTYPDVISIPDPVDLAVIAVPAADVLAVVSDCAAKGVKGLLVISAGFAETGAAGAELQHQVVELARAHGMRLIGPNCLGLANASADVRMNATFSPVGPEPGCIGFMSQSGALGISILEQAGRLGLGLSSFVSVGNKADVSGNDLLEYWEEDDATEVILLYLESFGNPARFARIARRVSETKPIVAVKSGRSAEGSRAARSHTAAAATPDVAVDALFHQAGVIRVDTLADLFDTARLLAHQPLPAGRRVAVVGNSGGPGILAADACASVGLTLAPLAESTQRALRELLPPGAAVENPVDLIASASPDQVQGALELVVKEDGIDAVVAIWTPPFAGTSTAVSERIARVGATTDKPIVAAILDPRMASLLAVPGRPDRAVPVYPYPEPAVRALARAVEVVEWRARPRGTRVEFHDIDFDAAVEAVRDAASRLPEDGWLDAADVDRILSCFGIHTVPTRTASTWDEVKGAADGLGYPVVLKASGPGLVHKSDVGGVHLDLRSEDELRVAWDEMRERLGRHMTGAVVQRMASERGVEVIVGLVQHADFGPLVMFGLGGVATDLLGDRAFRILPLTDADATELVHSVRAAPLLEGYRGAPPTDVPALIELLLRVGVLAETVPAITEMDLNPVLVGISGASVLDARIRLGSGISARRPGSRRLNR